MKRVWIKVGSSEKENTQSVDSISQISNSIMSSTENEDDIICRPSSWLMVYAIGKDGMRCLFDGRFL